MILGLPLEAGAESPITFSGYLRIRAFAMGGFFPPVKADTLEKRSDKYAVTRLRVNVVFKPTENLEVRWRFQGPHAARMGTTNSGDLGVRSIYFFGRIKTEYGHISIGRISYDLNSAGL